jgi:hypothetical protein
MRSRKNVTRRSHESSAAAARSRPPEVEILAGNVDVAGLRLALADWSAELRIILNEKRRQAGTWRRDVPSIVRIQLL